MRFRTPHRFLHQEHLGIDLKPLGYQRLLLVTATQLPEDPIRLRWRYLESLQEPGDLSPLQPVPQKAVPEVVADGGEAHVLEYCRHLRTAALQPIGGQQGQPRGDRSTW